MASLATPAPATPAPVTAAAPTNMRDLLASLPSPEPPVAEPTPASEATPQPATPETPPAEASPATEAIPAEAAEPDLTQEITGPDSQSEDGKRYFYTKNRAETLHAGYNNWRQLHEVMPNATVDGVKGAIQQALAADILMNQYHAGAQDVEALDQFLQVFGKDNHAAFGSMAQRSLDHLAMMTTVPDPGMQQSAKQALAAIRSRFTQEIINDARARVAQIQDPTAREHEANFVQHLEKRFAGQMTPREQLLASPDPNTAERQWILSERQKIEQFNQRQAEAAKQQVIHSIDSAEETAVVSEIEKALKPLEGRFNETQLSMARSQLEQAVKTLESSNQEWINRYLAFRMEAERNPSEQTKTALANYRRGIAQQAMRLKASSIIGAITASVVSQNNAASANGAPPRSESSPNGAMSPAPNGSVDAMLKAGSWKDVFTNLRGS